MHQISASRWRAHAKAVEAVTYCGAFGYRTSRRSSLNLLDLEEKVLEIHWRLAHVTIENRPYQDVIARYDRRHTFFYLDPPYYDMKVYRFNFEPKDFDEMAVVLAGIKGRFVMSLNDHKAVRRIFKNFRIQPVSLRYSCMRKPSSRGRERREVLICNY